MSGTRRFFTSFRMTMSGGMTEGGGMANAKDSEEHLLLFRSDFIMSP